MTHSTDEGSAPEPEVKKQNLADAAKEMLKKKKQDAQANAKKQPKYSGGGQQVMRSQHVQKPNNTRKKMGV